MKAFQRIITLCTLTVVAALGAEAVPPVKEIGECIDLTESVAVVDATLDNKFFRSKEKSYPWYIIEHDDGHLENTMGGKVSREDAIKLEHTAKCVSSHQGEHVMTFCDAEVTNDGLALNISGGLPAYASDLSLQIVKDKVVKCEFKATYPMSVPGEQLSWTITKKALKIKSESFKPGERLLGWLLVEFEETCKAGEKTSRQTHRIEGWIKPVIRKVASKASKQN